MSSVFTAAWERVIFLDIHSCTSSVRSSSFNRNEISRSKPDKGVFSLSKKGSRPAIFRRPPRNVLDNFFSKLLLKSRDFILASFHAAVAWNTRLIKLATIRRRGIGQTWATKLRRRFTLAGNLNTNQLNPYKRIILSSSTMAWRFAGSRFVKEGYLDNTRFGRTVGEIEFGGLGKIVLDLDGDMQGGLKRKLMSFSNPDYDPEFVLEHGRGRTSTAQEYMRDFDRMQRGSVGTMIGSPYLHLEWYSESNGRCVIELPARHYRIERA